METIMSPTKRLIHIALAIVLITAVVSGCKNTNKERQAGTRIYTSYREIPGVTDDEITAIEALKAQREKFTYGALLATEAFEMPDGSLAGFTKEFCEVLSGLFDKNFTLKLYDWDELIYALETQSLDFTGDLPPTEERGRAFNRSQPIAERMLRIFTHVDSDIRTESDISGLRIGFLTDSATAAAITHIYDLTFTTVAVDNYDEAARLIDNGGIDAFIHEAVADPAFSSYSFIRSQVLFPIIHSPVSLATANPDLAPIITVINKYIDAGGLERLYELYKNGDIEYSKRKLFQTFTPDELEYVNDLAQRNAAVAVAFENDNYPVSFYNEKDRAYEGIAVDVLAEITNLTGIRFESAVSKDVTWAEIFDKLSTGEVKMVSQLLFSQERKDRFLWGAEPYARSYYALLSETDHPNQETYQVLLAKVGAKTNSAMIDIFNEMFPDHSKLIEFDTQSECLDALEQGRVDLLMASEYMLLTQINYREKSGFKINFKFEAPLDSYFGYNKDEAILCSIIDKAQSHVKTDVIEMSWVGRNFDYSKKLAEERTRSLTVFLIVMFIMLSAAVFMLAKNLNLSKRLKEIANFDSLTNIYNRRFFMELASVQIARSLRTNIDCFVIIFDLDHFKIVNDTHGHLAGDKVLKDVAQRVKNAIRPYDILGRYGGEEFIILMTDIKELKAKKVVTAVERIRQEICKAPIEFETIEIPISASFGVAYAAPVNDLATAIRYADEALYEAKETGRNRVVFFDQENQDHPEQQ